MELQSHPAVRVEASPTGVEDGEGGGEGGGYGDGYGDGLGVDAAGSSV